MESEEANYPLLLSEVIRPVIEDIGLFVAELEAIQNNLDAVVSPVRDQMLAEELILSCEDGPSDGDLQAVDAASVPLNRESLALVVACGVRMGASRQLRVEYARRSGENTEDFRRVGTALRLMLEYRLLQDADEITIIDNSFWSLLMDSNQVVTIWKNRLSGELQAAFRQPIEECFAKNGTFIRTLRNPNLVAISKTASSDRISQERGLSPPIADRTLLTAILRPGEYLKPTRITQGVGGNFGIERDISDWEEIRRIYMGSGPQSLFVTFYRPWEFQRAYRLEFHGERFNDRQALEGLLRRVKHETRIRTIMEPISQYMADMVSKQVQEAAPLYVRAAMHKYPRLMGPYRTGGWSR